MGTIVARKRNDGSYGYRAQIILKQKGVVVHRESQTFDRKEAAKAWVKRRETELAEPGALEKKEDPKFRDVIDRYISESKKAIGRTKTQVLNTVKNSDLGEMRCSKLTSADFVAFAKGLGVGPATAGNYLSHIGAVCAVARPAWHYPLDQMAIRDAMKVTRHLGLTGKSKQRNRRPTMDELDLLMQHFGKIRARRPSSMPMQKIIGFALFSTRRQEELTRLARKNWDEKHSRILVRDMKHPGDKEGNDQWCDLPPEAMKILKAVTHAKELFFPYSADAISAAFTRACQFLEIDDLRFHDLRHEGISRLFEMGWSIPKVATVSGHRSWSSLKRYTHIREAGDKYAGWKWLSVIIDPGSNTSPQ
jgi:integrase